MSNKEEKYSFLLPLFLGILSFSVGYSSNRIASSNLEIAKAQSELNKELSKENRLREETQLDAQILDLFGKYYFGGDPEQQVFAIKITLPLSTNSASIKQVIHEYVNKQVSTDPKRRNTSEGKSIIQQTSWIASPPSQGWCFQRKEETDSPNRRYLVRCLRLEEQCKQLTQQTSIKTSCKLVKKLNDTGWNPGFGGLLDSWYKYKTEQFESPFPNDFNHNK